MVQSIWIEVHQEMSRHPKTLALAQALKISRREAVGLLIDLWTWGLSCADETGFLRVTSPDGIAMAMDWPLRQAGKLVDALVSCGWIDQRGSSYSLHDWEDYTSRLSDKRRDAERKRNARKSARNAAKQACEKNSHDCANMPMDCPEESTGFSMDCPENVRGLSADSPGKKAVNPRADITQPNQTKPNHSNLNAATIPVSTDMSGQEEALRRVCDEFSGAIHAPNAKEREQLRILLEEYGPSALSAAIQEASGKGRSPAYLRKILEAWSASGGDLTREGVPANPSYDIEAYERFSRQALMETEGGDPCENRACDPG